MWLATSGTRPCTSVVAANVLCPSITSAGLAVVVVDVDDKLSCMVPCGNFSCRSFQIRVKLGLRPARLG